VLGVEKEKDRHEWQQTLAESKRFLEVFSEPDDLVCDPCGGSFTNAVGTYLLRRAFVGCDLDERNVRIGKQRVAEAGRGRSEVG
jgi:DNA modification methylase